MKPLEGRSRVVIEDVAPVVDAGRYPVCRILGDIVEVTAAIFGDGHDHLAARLVYRHQSERHWRSVPMKEVGNDVWSAEFLVDRRDCGVSGFRGGWITSIRGFMT